MKALSLWQPWASLIAFDIKRFETRDWPPPAALIGHAIAIHAAKKAVDSDNREWARREGVEGDLPLGAVVCTAILQGAYRCGAPASKGLVRISRHLGPLPLIGPLGAQREVTELPIDDYGDYSPGRWAWCLIDIRRFDPPISARGAQGLWDWRP